MTSRRHARQLGYRKGHDAALGGIRHSEQAILLKGKLFSCSGLGDELILLVESAAGFSVSVEQEEDQAFTLGAFEAFVLGGYRRIDSLEDRNLQLAGGHARIRWKAQDRNQPIGPNKRGLSANPCNCPTIPLTLSLYSHLSST